MKRFWKILSLVMVAALLLPMVFACAPDEPVTDTTTTKPDDDGTTTAEPDDDGTTTTKPVDDGTTTTAAPDDGDDDPDADTTTTAAPDGGDDDPDADTTTTAAPDGGDDDPDADTTTTAAPDGGDDDPNGDGDQIEAEFVPVIRFVACSDTHITATDDEVAERFKKMFESAYRFAAADENYKNLDAVIIAGDFVDDGHANRYAPWNELVPQVLREGTQLVTVMGNHEYINGNHETYLKYWNQPLDQHVVINGFHFIGLSPSPELTRNEYSDTQVAWMSEQLAAAAAEDPTRPIFTFQHLHIKDTVFYSHSEYTPTSEKLNNAYKAYPQVINFSGDSHGPINNPRSIYQKDYTLLGTGTVQYTWTSNLYNVDGNTRPSGWKEAGQYYIVEVDASNRVRVYVYDILTDGLFKTTWIEENPNGGMIYEIDTPSDKSSFTYTDERGDELPYFGNTASIAVSDIAEDAVTITFPQAFHSAGAVYGYRITVECLSDTTWAGYEMLKSSRYYDEPMPATMTFGVSELADGERYRVSVYPMNAWGKEGTPLTCEFTTAEAVTTPYTSENRVYFNGTFSGFDCHTELTTAINHLPFGRDIDGDLYTGGAVNNGSPSVTPYASLAPRRGYQGSAALAAVNTTGVVAYYATPENGNATHFHGAAYLRLWVDFSLSKFEEGSFGVYTRSGERFSAYDAPSNVNLTYYTLTEGESTWETRTFGENATKGCFGSDMDGFKGWIAVPFDSLYSLRSTQKRQLDTDSVVGFFYYWKYATGSQRGYLDEIQFVADYTVFETYKGEYTNDFVAEGDELGRTEHLSVKATLTEGDSFFVIATGADKDWVYVMDKASADAGAAPSRANVYARWTMADVGSGVTIDAAKQLVVGRSIGVDEYVVRYVPNGGDMTQYTEEIVVRVVKPNQTVNIDSHADALTSTDAGVKFLPVTGTDKTAISLGQIDLSKYQAVKICYGASAEAGTADQPLALLSGSVVDKTLGKDAANVLGYALMEATEGCVANTYYVTVDLSKVTANGEVFLTAFDYTEETVEIYSVEFIAWPYGVDPSLPVTTYKVTYKDADGETLETLTGKAGAKVPAPTSTWVGQINTTASCWTDSEGNLYFWNAYSRYDDANTVGGWTNSAGEVIDFTLTGDLTLTQWSEVVDLTTVENYLDKNGTIQLPNIQTNVYDIGAWDLSKYSAIRITYGRDDSVKAGTLLLLAANDKTSTPVVSMTMVQVPLDYTAGPATVTVDLSAVSESYEHLYLAVSSTASTGCYRIEFIPYSANTYTVTYQDQNGDVIEARKIDKGEMIPAPTVALKGVANMAATAWKDAEGNLYFWNAYTMHDSVSGWVDVNGEPVDFKVMRDVTLTRWSDVLDLSTVENHLDITSGAYAGGVQLPNFQTNIFDLGAWDLSQYSAIRITYGRSSTVTNGTLLLLAEANKAATPVASTTLIKTPADYLNGATTVTVDLSAANASYEHLYLAVSGTASTSCYRIEFIRKGTTYTVTYLSKDGGTLETRTVDRGAMVPAPPVTMQGNASAAINTEATAWKDAEGNVYYYNYYISTQSKAASWTDANGDPVDLKVMGDMTLTPWSVVVDLSQYGGVSNRYGIYQLTDHSTSNPCNLGAWNLSQYSAVRFTYGAGVAASSQYKVQLFTKDGETSTTLASASLVNATGTWVTGAPTVTIDLSQVSGRYTNLYIGTTKSVGCYRIEFIYDADYTGKSYTVTWKVEGQEDVTETYGEGETPVYPNGTPKKAADEQYAYFFAGWDEEIVAVTGNATYTATFTALEIGEGVAYTDHLYAKTTFVEGEDILVTAFGSGKDWVYIVDQASLDAGTAINQGNSYKWWDVTDKGSGVAVNLSEILSADKLTAGVYRFRFVPNGAGVSRYTEEIVITVLPA